MAAGSNIRAGRAFVELTTKNNLFLRGLDKAARQFKSFGFTVTKIGAGITASIAGIEAAAIGIITPIAHFSDIYQQLLNRVMATNDEAAASTAVLSHVMEELFAIARRARTPIESLVELYSRLALAGKESELGQQQLLNISETISKAAAIGGGSQESISSALVQLSQIFGGGNEARGIGQELASIREQAPFLFRIMAEGLQRVGVSASGTTGEMRKLAESGVLTGKNIAAAILSMSSDVEDRFGRITPTIGSAFTNLRNTAIKTLGELSQETGFGRAISDIIFEIGDRITDLAAKLRPTIVGLADWISRNRQLVITIAKVVGGVFAAGVAITALGVVIAGTGVVLGAIVKVIGVVGMALAAIFSPIGLIATGLIAAAAAFVYFTETGQAAARWLMEKFGQLRTFVSDVIGGIVDALTKGDITLAAQILWAGVKVAWLEGTMFIRALWNQVQENFVKAVAGTVAGVRAAWTAGVYAIEVAWTNTVAFLGDLWDGFIGAFTSIWDSAVSTVAKGLNYIRSLWDDSFDPEAAAAAADQIVRQNEDARRKAEMAAREQRETKRQQDRESQDREFAQDLERIRARYAEMAGAAEQNAAQDLTDAINELSRLRGELTRLREEAAQPIPSASPLAYPEAPPWSLSRQEDISAGLEKAIAGVFSSTGTFNPFGATQMGAGGPLERTAKATEETARIAKKYWKGNVAVWAI